MTNRLKNQKYLNYSNFDNFNGNYKPLVLYINTIYIDNLNKVGDYLQDNYDINYELKKHEIIQADFISDIMKSIKILINDNLKIIAVEMKDIKTILKQLKNQIEEYCYLLRLLK